MCKVVWNNVKNLYPMGTYSYIIDILCISLDDKDWKLCILFFSAVQTNILKKLKS